MQPTKPVAARQRISGTKSPAACLDYFANPVDEGFLKVRVGIFDKKVRLSLNIKTSPPTRPDDQPDRFDWAHALSTSATEIR